MQKLFPLVIVIVFFLAMNNSKKQAEVVQPAKVTTESKSGMCPPFGQRNPNDEINPNTGFTRCEELYLKLAERMKR